MSCYPNCISINENRIIMAKANKLSIEKGEFENKQT